MKQIILAISALLASAEGASIRPYSLVQYRPTAEAAPWYKEQSTGDTWMDPKWPVNYAVPNFGKDHEIISTQQSIADSEKVLKHDI